MPINVVDIPLRQITKVATAVKFGVIMRVDANTTYRQTWRPTGNAAPGVDDLTEFVDLFPHAGVYAHIESDIDIDVYVYTDYLPGKVRVDT